MSKLKDIHTVELGKRTILIDSVEEICISVNTEYYKECEVENSYSIINRILKEQSELKRKRVAQVNTVYLFITNNCNLSCTFCSMRSNKKEEINSFELTVDTLMNNIVPMINEIKPRRIIISGGEPFIHNEIAELIDCIYTKTEAQVIVQSNGLLLNDTIINRIAGRVNRVEISTAHFSNCTENLITFIQRMNVIKTEVTLSFVYNNNDSAMYQILDIAANQNTDFIFNFVSSTGSALDDNIKIMSSEEKLQVYLCIAKYIIAKKYTCTKLAQIFFRNIQVQKQCSALGRALVIFPDGNIYICHSLANREFRVGDINTDSTKMILKKWNELIKQMDVKKLFHVELKEYCEDCKFKYLCGGGCGAEQFNHVKIDCMLQKVIITYNLLIYNSKCSNLQNINSFVKFCEEKQYLKYIV
ncbi:hypothetical protein acsn021_23710 [Anaerocolumna cellulosilytica]|uniref:Uncharacterized protein n=1 Tax=Anaerocolumna cellulosilytica TaxID=433286 RepID=A0A6S6R5T5_9FIRM|nr:radical SAM/SPASM domain-containing protein [Anaerocolumna cellulosilytica]MBB5193984.1 radical SAM protein with 4Fe4S-binding SPASM domain [Anaerocolumna cellulosilytica]BCJ94802.1 hypothetical protein acsn021_23710 [Anaerocolumna cellulosilytica]